MVDPGGPPRFQDAAAATAEHHHFDADDIPFGPDASRPYPSPGLMDRHYAPRATLRLVPRARRDGAAAEAARARAAGARSGALLLSPWAAPIDYPVHMPADPRAYARELYAALHALDDAGCDVVFADEVPPDPAWDGVRDRLRRASR